MTFQRIIIAGLLAVFTAVYSTVTQAADQPNVIYILADDLGYGDLSCYGQTKLRTPNIDRLATEGLRFTSHYSGNTVCSPSRAVLMTGQHSGHCYLRGNTPEEKATELDPSMTVLPELFKAAGYATGAYGKWGLGYTVAEGDANPLRHGFDEFFGWKSQTIAHTYYPSTVVHNGREIPLEPGTFVHDLILDHARAFIRRNAESDTPFFCYIPTAVPHAAMHAPGKLHDKWRKKFPEFDDVVGRYGAGDEECPDVRNPIAGFAAMMENLDNEVGSILDLLHELDIDRSTLVLFTSDNGAHKEGGHDPEFWNSTGGLRGHKRDMHEGGIRVPLLARWPAVISPGTTTDHVSGFQDVLPTVAELLEQPLPEQNDGISFVPTLHGSASEQPAHEFLYWEFCRGLEHTIFSHAVRMGPWKGYQESGGSLEVYNLSEDPFETNNLAGDRPDIAGRLAAAIRKAHLPPPR